jgi:hypothetical protein
LPLLQDFEPWPVMPAANATLASAFRMQMQIKKAFNEALHDHVSEKSAHEDRRCRVRSMLVCVNLKTVIPSAQSER